MTELGVGASEQVNDEWTNEWTIVRTEARIMLHMHITYHMSVCCCFQTEPNRAQHINDYMIVMMGLLSMENDTPMSDRALFKFIRFSLSRVSMNEKFDEIVNSFAFIFHSQTNCLWCIASTFEIVIPLCIRCVCECLNSNLTVNNLTFINQVQHVQMLITYIWIKPMHTHTHAGCLMKYVYDFRNWI